MTASILSPFGYPITNPDALRDHVEHTRAFLERPLRCHRVREGQLWERLAEHGEQPLGVVS